MIYFIQAENDLIKIGYTNDVKQRLRTLRTMSPERLNLMKTIKGDQKQETLLHRRFKHLRSHGEWFRSEQELLDYIIYLHSPEYYRELLQKKPKASKHFSSKNPY
ncbi:hypothetical protein LCGC14_3046080 [marine sediment metagenome]|uniref:Bacteriophage T5 Orf172 DNA-binding domain-containing protein n=1 Tax=marine sediment metagenome TaxID=412755 RepID=A0A0F8ZE15_9ZZZZ